MKGKVMTLQERRMLCKTVATSDNCLGDYYRLYRQAKNYIQQTLMHQNIHLHLS